MRQSISIIILFVCLSSCAQPANHSKLVSPKSKTAYFAAGCFWCVEAVFESIKGVEDVTSGYAGGKEKNPTYELICSGNSMHAETIKITYDSTVINYDTLLVAFFGSHDPSTLNQQGPDFGPQYRSIIFYQSLKEKQQAERYIARLIQQKVHAQITTELTPFTVFYPAEIYHQDYEKNNPNNRYIQLVSKKRVAKFKKKLPHLLKID
ncbi:MAG: peptide-methionine (S)-S-oxide reductase MsrA [Crocinitomicaceae bacterium]|nr:peptide-methionine (S)-S-oxide reductase MsrA [Crocinitomicaceae bacterium]